ncbi:MAG: hypothetical protein WC178_04420 [Candidatus Paceibacterota bacterium]
MWVNLFRRTGFRIFGTGIDLGACLALYNHNSVFPFLYTRKYEYEGEI